MKRGRLAFIPLQFTCVRKAIQQRIVEPVHFFTATPTSTSSPKQFQSWRPLSTTARKNDSESDGNNGIGVQHAQSDEMDSSSSSIRQTPDYSHNYLDPTNKYMTNTRHLYLHQQRHDNEEHQHGHNQNYHSNSTLATSRHGLNPRQSKFHHPMVYHPHYSAPNWPPQHSFPMNKFHYLASNLTTKQTHLPRPLVRSMQDFYTPLNCHELPRAWYAQPTGPIEPTYLDMFLSASLTTMEERRIGFRQYTKLAEVRERTVLEVGGTILASQLACEYGIATNLAGGTHHAGPDCGAGYTILNDLAIAANFLLKSELNGGSIKGIERVLVVDADVHQGDGTAKFDKVPILGDKLVTLSLHCESNYPTPKAHSTYDVPLPDKMKDEEYLQIFKESVNQAIIETSPDFVLYDAGIDVHQHDLLGRLSLTDKGIRMRDRWVFDKCVQEGIPVAAVIGGGYDKDPVTLAKRHAIVHEEAAYVWRKYQMWNQ